MLRMPHNMRAYAAAVGRSSRGKAFDEVGKRNFAACGWNRIVRKFVHLSPGEKLGPYEIRSLIGAGGMGTVYKAQDVRLDRTVAIKILNEQFSERFRREGRAIASLNHP